MARCRSSRCSWSFGNAGIQWVVTAYVLAFGGFLLFGGRAADLFGRRRMLLGGMVACTVCPFLVGISRTRRCSSCSAPRRASPPP